MRAPLHTGPSQAGGWNGEYATVSGLLYRLKPIEPKKGRVL